MTAETLVEKYLQQDISKPEFWTNSLDIVQESIQEFEVLADKVAS